MVLTVFSTDCLWELAAGELRDREREGGYDGGGETERSVFLMGSKAGVPVFVTNHYIFFLYIIITRDEPPKPTLALEYTFGRRARGHSSPKDIVHLWELGGGTSLSDLVQIPISAVSIRSFSVILVVDLSKPNSLWTTVEKLLQTARAQLEKVFAQVHQKQKTKNETAVSPAARVLPKDHPDRELIHPFPVPLLIIGSKYDLFQEMDSDTKRVVSKTLRFLSHFYAASLLFTSIKSESLMSRTKNFFSHHAFGLDRGKTVSCDSTKPLVIPAGSDSFSQIGTPPAADVDVSSLHAKSPKDLWKKVYEGVFPPESVEHQKEVKDPGRDLQYREDSIDATRAQKDQELEQFKRNAAKSWRGVELDA
uniref:Cytoplasmic dynein 2 light intermediate chain 1 n=1 Tax=Cynoglossus semilaevis TaxID=244447 RepID=A0A3P8UZ96_CYNSE